MKPREGLTPEPTPVHRAKVHELICQLVAARDRGEVMHQHPLRYELEGICGVMAGDRFAYDEPRTPEELREFEEAILTYGPVWKSQ